MSGPLRRRGGPRRYRSGDRETYALGEWPALEALRHRPQLVQAVLLDPALAGMRRVRLEQAAASAGVGCHDDARTLRALRHRSDARALALMRCEGDALACGPVHLALAGTRTAGNLGTVLRTALGFDVRDVALIGSSLDPWSPHVLRASQGARCALRVECFADWDSYRSAHGRRALVWFAAPRPGHHHVALPELRVSPPATLAFGPEWPAPCDAGTAAAAVRTATPSAPPADACLVSIPQHADLESHNLAVAVGIALYALREAGGGRPGAC